MPRGALPLSAHQVIEPIVSLPLIAAPWILGFSDNDTATTISVIAGLVVLVTGMSTRWRMSFFVIPRVFELGTHGPLGRTRRGPEGAWRSGNVGALRARSLSPRRVAGSNHDPGEF
jgi:SPW repeat